MEKNEEIGKTTIGQVRRNIKNTFSVVEDEKRAKNNVILGSFIVLALIATTLFFKKPVEEVRVSKEDLIEAEVYSSGELIDESTVKVKAKKKSRTAFEAPRLLTRYDALDIPEIKIKAKLVHSVAKGQVHAKLLENFRVNGELVSRAGAEVVGKVTAASPERILINFHTMEAITGDKFSVVASAFDEADALEGIAPSQAKQKAWNVAHKIAFTFLGGLADGLQTRSTMGRKLGGTVENAFLEGASRVANDEAQNTISNAQSKEVVTPISAGKEFVLYFSKKDDAYGF
ncbi:MAG: TrbI/VirB10 family protein [Bdellovibrionota bacterium]